MTMFELEQSLIEAQKLLFHHLIFNRGCNSINRERYSKEMSYRCICSRLRRKLGMESAGPRYELNRLQISLDKIQLANNSSRSRCFKLCSSVKEVDHHSLHFGMLHGIKNLSEEKKILQKLKEVEKESSSAQCTEDYKTIMNRSFPFNGKEIKKLKQQTEEEEIQSCAVNGHKWRSLGAKEDILKNIKSLREQYGNEDDAVLLKKKLAAVENDLRSLDKQSRDVHRLIDEGRNWISQMKEQNHKNKANETHLLNKTTSFINSLKEKSVSLKKINKAFKRLQQE